MESIELGSLEYEVHRRWVRGRPGEIGHAVIGYGLTADGRWFVAQFARRGTMAWVALDEGHAGDVVQKWINRRGGMGRWRELSPERSASVEAAG